MLRRAIQERCPGKESMHRRVHHHSILGVPRHCAHRRLACRENVRLAPDTCSCQWVATVRYHRSSQAVQALLTRKAGLVCPGTALIIVRSPCLAPKRIKQEPRALPSRGVPDRFAILTVTASRSRPNRQYIQHTIFLPARLDNTYAQASTALLARPPSGYRKDGDIVQKE